MMLCCPITSSIKGYSTEVALPQGLQTKGVVLSSQIRAMDWRAREPEFVEAVPKDLLEQTLDVLLALMES
jgi:mRNA interferase MazF